MSRTAFGWSVLALSLAIRPPSIRHLVVTGGRGCHLASPQHQKFGNVQCMSLLKTWKEWKWSQTTSWLQIWQYWPWGKPEPWKKWVHIFREMPFVELEVESCEGETAPAKCGIHGSPPHVSGANAWLWENSGHIAGAGTGRCHCIEAIPGDCDIPGKVYAPPIRDDRTT